MPSEEVSIILREVLMRLMARRMFFSLATTAETSRSVSISSSSTSFSKCFGSAMAMVS